MWDDCFTFFSITPDFNSVWQLQAIWTNSTQWNWKHSLISFLVAADISLPSSIVSPLILRRAMLTGLWPWSWSCCSIEETLMYGLQSLLPCKFMWTFARLHVRTLTQEQHTSKYLVWYIVCTYNKIFIRPVTRGTLQAESRKRLLDWKKGERQTRRMNYLYIFCHRAHLADSFNSNESRDTRSHGNNGHLGHSRNLWTVSRDPSA